MGLFSDIVSGAKDLIGIGQDAYNLTKDINNTDTNRQVVAHQQNSSFDKELDYYYNKQLQEAQFAQAEKMFGESVAANKAAQERQFNMNAALSSPARDAMLKRSVGLNSENASGSSSSVSAPSASAPTPASASVGSSGGSASPSHYSSSNGLTMGISSQIRESNSRSELNESQANLNKIEQLFKVDKQIVEIEEAKSRIYKNYAEGGKLTAEGKAIIEKLDIELDNLREQQELLRAQTNYYTKSAIKAEQEGNAVEQNAETAARQQEELARHNKAIESIQSRFANVAERGVKIDEQKLDSQLQILMFQANQEFYKTRMTRIQAMKFGERLVAEIDNCIQLTEESKARARKLGMEADEYKKLVTAQIAREYAQAAFYGSFSLANILSGITKLTKGIDSKRQRGFENMQGRSYSNDSWAPMYDSFGSGN